MFTFTFAAELRNKVRRTEYPAICKAILKGIPFRVACSVLVPLSVFGDSPPEAVSVVDLDGREVSFVLSGRTFFTDSAAGTEVFAGWSYWEDEDTDFPGSPAVELFVRHPDFSAADYPRG